MKKKLKKKWVKALRSGKYDQGTGGLHSEDDNTHCCLGVLCEVLVKKDKKNFSKHGDSFIFNNKRMLGELNDELLKKVKITDEQQVELICMNDSDDMSFKKIAKYIEKNL